MRKNTFISLFLVLSMTTPVMGQDIISNLMQDSLATFSEARRLIYYSFLPATKSEDSQKKQKNVSEQEINDFLWKQGIEMPSTNRPIRKDEFAKAVIQRYHLKTGWLTRVTRQPRHYFDDARRLGLFNTLENPDETMTTQELLNVYLKAQKMSHQRRQ